MKARFLFAVVLLLPTVLCGREWTDASGRLRREAEYVDHDATRVWVRDHAGKMFVAARDRLSAIDQQYVSSLEQRRSSARRTMPVRTLAFRTTTAASDAKTSAARHTKQLADSVARLTGWHCHGGHCYVTVHHQPTPVPPAPSTSIKRIYTGCYSTFHLVCRDPAPAICGTGAYKFAVASGVQEYLVRLRYAGTVGPGGVYLVYTVEAPAPLGITHWFFENPATPIPGYRIYYFHPVAGVVLYEPHAHRRIPL